jgi:hypothetical protein
MSGAAASTSRSLNKVRTFTCPVVRVPDKSSSSSSSGRSNQKKREFGEFDTRASQGLPQNSGKKQFESKKAKYATPATEMNEIMKEIKELSSTSLTGSARKKYKEDVLTKLGAPPAKEQTMPFRMKMGILAGRKRREERVDLEQKSSGVVSAKKGKAKKPRMSEKELDRSLGVPDWNVNTFKGVLHLPKKNTR